MITSNQNSKIKLVRALLSRSKERREAELFVIEGVRLFEEAVNSNWEIKFVLYDETLNERGKKKVESLKNIEVEEVSASVMKSISETESPQGILAVLKFSQLPIPDSLNFVLIPDQIRDPGNLGTLLRSAVATGVQAILIPPDTTDAFAPKVLRSGMGAHFKLPIQEMSWEEINQVVKPESLQVLIADMNGESCWKTDLTKPTVLIIGSEADGASESARKLANGKISIPMSGDIESLNAGVAGSVLMFETFRQRNIK
ncbi:MAG: RNA methyltransferase [Anaerolineales bacterium]|nr:RNA methyltransferase [Anaerolineales bacterium]